MLPTNFIEGRQSVKEITCDLIQVARAEMGAVGAVGVMGKVRVMGEEGAVGEV